MSSYDPESSSIEKFMISRLFYIFIMLPYLSPFTSYNPFYDKIQLITQLYSHFSYVDFIEETYFCSFLGTLGIYFGLYRYEC